MPSPAAAAAAAAAAEGAESSIFADARRKLRPVSGSLTLSRADSQRPPLLVHGTSDANATGHDNVDDVAGDFVDNIESAVQSSSSPFLEAAAHDDVHPSAASGCGSNDDNRGVTLGFVKTRVQSLSPARRDRAPRTAMSAGSTPVRNSAAVPRRPIVMPSINPQSESPGPKISPPKDVSSGASRRLRASPKYQHFLAKNKSEAAAAPQEVAAPETTALSEKTKRSASDKSQNQMKVDDRILPSPPSKNDFRPFSRLPEMDFFGGDEQPVQSITNESMRPFPRQAVSAAPAVVAELDDIIARACGEPKMMHSAEDFRSGIVGNGDDNFFPLPITNVGHPSASVNNMAEASSKSHLQSDDDDSDSSAMVSFSDDSTVKQGNVVTNQVGRRRSMGTSKASSSEGDVHATPTRVTTKGKAFASSPKRSSFPGMNESADSSSDGLALLEVQNGKLRNEVARLLAEIGVKDSIISDLKERLNHLKPNEGNRVEAKSLKRALQEQRKSVPLKADPTGTTSDRRFLC